MAQQEQFDVWLIAVDTVYTGVPYSVLTDWAGTGRLAATDKLRPHGSTSPWMLVKDHPQISDFLFQPKKVIAPPSAVSSPSTQPQEALEPIEMDLGWKKRTDDDDDEVDMIPLIDISLVLLIFFMMTASVASMSSVDVPGMRNAGELSKDVDAITIMIDKRANEPLYSLRAGDRGAEKDDSNLESLNALMAQLDRRLSSGVSRPPEVRIACDQALPRRYVRELAQELTKRKAKGQIAYYGAEVNELTGQ